jgi:hypothetical protein
MAINLISKIKPKNNGVFPVYEDVDGYGGFQTRDSISDRNSIPILNRKIGMLVYVRSDRKYYTLQGGISNSNWIESSPGTIGSKLPVLKGGNTANEMYIDLLSGSASTSDTAFTVIGATRLDPSILSTPGDGYRTIRFEVIMENVGGPFSPAGFARLYNYTASGVVDGSILSTTSSTPYFLSTEDLTTNTNFSPNEAIYQAQIKMDSGGSSSDIITCTKARLIVKWTQESDPPIMEGIVAWFDPSYGITALDQEPVNTWLDRTGNASHTMSGGITPYGNVDSNGSRTIPPTFHASDASFAGHPTLEFTYDHNYPIWDLPLWKHATMASTIPWDVNYTNLTYYLVARTGNDEPPGTMIDGWDTTVTQISSGGGFGYLMVGGNVVNDPSLNTRIPYVLCANIHLASASYATFTTGTPATFNYFNDTTFSHLAFGFYGRQYFTFNTGNFTMAYLLIYEGTHNSNQRTRIMQWLGSIFGIIV